MYYEIIIFFFMFFDDLSTLLENVLQFSIDLYMQKDSSRFFVKLIHVKVNVEKSLWILISYQFYWNVNIRRIVFCTAFHEETLETKIYNFLFIWFDIWLCSLKYTIQYNNHNPNQVLTFLIIKNNEARFFGSCSKNLSKNCFYCRKISIKQKV